MKTSKNEIETFDQLIEDLNEYADLLYSILKKEGLESSLTSEDFKKAFDELGELPNNSEE